MVNFFIGRPIFATVLALLMLLVGSICLYFLPIAQYPQIAPPQVQITTAYTGADAETVAETVTTPIEQQLNGTEGMIYFSSSSTSNGLASIVATFEVGYDQDIAAVDVQNRVQTATPQLPPEVKQYGVSIKKTSTDMVTIVNLSDNSGENRYDQTFLDNYGQIHVADALKRIPGVSDVMVFGRRYAMRIWIDPERMAEMKIAPAELIQAVQQENLQAAAGRVGTQPVPKGQAFEYPLTVKGRLTDVSEFEEIIVRRRDDGSIVRLKDVARVELDSESYESTVFMDGRPAGGMAVFQHPDANALSIVKQVQQEMNRLARNFPPGLEYGMAYNTTHYVEENIAEVEHTLLEAFLLVMIVVFIFLQGWRATIIPMLAIPVSLIATFGLMSVFGFSLNTLTLCGLVLAIGLVVDDAIIVVENVEKHLERGLRPLAATRAAMAEITAPIVTITLVLAAVFVPVAFIPGLTGMLYNQFAMTVVFSFVFSAFNSLTFSPAMARLFLRARHGEARFFLFRWFNRAMKWLESSYDGILEYTAHRWWLIVVPSLGLLALTTWMIINRPKAFIPTEDMGYLIAAIQAPDGTSLEKTTELVHRVDRIARQLPGVAHTVAVSGRNILSNTSQSNAAFVFLPLKPWSERNKPELRSGALAGQLQGMMFGQIRDAIVMVVEPPPIRGLSQTGGFEMMVEDRDGKGVQALQRVVDQLQAAAARRPELAKVFSTFSARVPQLRFELDRTKARRLDVPVSDVFAVLQTNLGSYYINDFNLYGKVWKVMLQAEGEARRRPEDVLDLSVLNRQGEKVPLSALGEVRYVLGAIDVPHYNLFATARVNGGPAPGFSSGQAVKAMEEVARSVLPEGFSFEWTGTTFQEQKTGNISTYIFGLSILTVFLFMSALYESWVRPLVIILTVPLATFGAIVGLWFYNMPLDVFAQIGLVMLIGLETKNAILLVEFGVEMRERRGMGIVESAKAASRERLRPILMTSFAFVMGVIPMVQSTGAGAASRNSLGVVIAFGIAVSTVLGRFVIPIYYVLGERIISAFAHRRGRDEEPEGDELAPTELDAPSGNGRSSGRPGLPNSGDAEPVYAAPGHAVADGDQDRLSAGTGRTAPSGEPEGNADAS